MATLPSTNSATYSPEVKASRSKLKSMRVISRAEAVKLGLLRYFTGQPCPQGHIAERLCSSFGCMECARIKSRAEKPKRQALRSAKEAATKAADPRIITSQEAAASGLLRYFSGKPCKKGHISERWVSSRNCAECVRENSITEKHRIRVRVYCAANREKISSYQADYKARYPERVKAIHKKKRVLHKAKYADYSKNYKRANKAIVRASTRRRRAKRLDVGGTHTASDVAEIMVWQKRKCAVCSTRLKSRFHVDHVVPISRGGSNDRRNLQILCQPCNNTKHAKDPIDFMRSLGRLL